MSHSVSGNIDSFNISNSFNKVWNNCTVADEDSGILDWLSPLEPQTRHHDIRTRRVDQVGEWLLQTKEYQNWLGGIREDESNCSALFCYGSPGVGKSYISSLVIDTLCKQAVEESAAVACYYFDFAAQEQSPDAILGSVLKQVVGALDEVPERIVKAFRDRRKAVSGQKLVGSEIVEFLKDITSSRPIFICIDALDEYPARHRVELLDLLNQSLQKAPGARLFLTGRPHIRSEVEEHLGRAATRSIAPAKNDIITLLRAKLKEDTMPDAMDECLREEIIQKLPETVSEIFLLASLSIDMILQETTICLRREKLREMESNRGLGEAYGKTMERIKAQGQGKERLGMAVLMWISHSRRPLQVDEIRYALATRIESNDLDSDNIPGISTMLACCQGLAIIENGTSTVRLIHFTLQEYLCEHPDLFNRAHSTIAETCLTYLNLQHVKDLSVDPPPNPQSALFLEYSSLYWGTHMRIELSPRAKALAIQLLQLDSHISTKLLWGSINGAPSIQASSLSNSSLMPYIPDWKEFSPLHCISCFGIAEVADTLINMDKWDVNKIDGAGMTPLIWAARYGNEEVVSLLLRTKNIQPDQQDTNFGRTALSWAAGNGHEGVVKLFLEPRFVNPGSRGRRWGKAALVTDLVFSGRYVNPDSSSESRRTPLSWAASNGHEGIVKLLLGRKEVNPDTPDMFSQTPLSCAAESGHGEIVKLLLDRKDVDPDIRDPRYGQTLLSWAAANGHEGIVKLLLGRKDVNRNSSCDSGRTPLAWAASNGYKGVVMLLLGQKDVNHDTRDKDGQTPLSLATANGHEEIAKLLLPRDDVNPSSSSESGQTQLTRAAENLHTRVVGILQARYS